MDIRTFSRKDIGNLGERVTAEYLRRRGYDILAMNIARKTGELDVIAHYKEIIHIVEVKSILCEEFPTNKANNAYDPGMNLYANKIRKVARTAEWYIADIKWEGEWQIDGSLVWLRARDGMAKVLYLPQIL